MAPNCAANDYCFSTKSCTASCNTLGYVDCGALGTSLCGVSGGCVNAGLTACLAAPNPYNSLTPIQYTVVASYPHTITTTGWQTYVIPAASPVTVNAGYIIGYVAAIGRVGTRALQTGEASDWTATGPFTPTTTLTNGVSANMRHLVRGVANGPSSAIFYHTYSTGGLYNITVKAANDYLPAFSVAASLIIVGTGINDSTIYGPTVVAVGSIETYSLLPHSGKPNIFLHVIANFMAVKPNVNTKQSNTFSFHNQKI